MKNFTRLSAFAFLLAFPLSISLHAHAQAFTNLADEAEAGGFDVTAQVSKLPVEWSLNTQENGDSYRLRLAPDSIALSIQSGGKNTPLASAKTTVAPGPIIIQRRGPRWLVISQNRIALQAEDDRWMEGTLGWRGGEVKDARLQPVEEIVFDDDFMRVAKELAFSAAAKADPHNGVKARDAKIDETIWRSLSGTWATTGISEQEQAMVAQSANPFAFASKNKGQNFAVAGRPFWSDYSIEAAIKPHNSASIGLAIYVQDDKNYLLFDWARNGKMEIRAVINGAVRVLAGGAGEGYDEKNWYRLKFAARSGVLQAWVDEEEVLNAKSGLFGRGQVGLSCNNLDDDQTGTLEKTAVFDDLRVRSALNFYDDFSSVVAGRWQTASGAWKLQNAASPADDKGAFTIMGESLWRDYTARADVLLPADAVAGLVAHHLKGQGAFIFRVAGSKSKLPYAGKAQIVRIGSGKSTTLAEISVGARFDNSNGRWSFACEKGYLQGTVEIGGKATRVIDAWSEESEGGRAGIYAQRGGKGVPVLKNFAVEFPRQKSVWASVPDIYVDPKQAETMGEWSTPEGLWLPVNPLKTGATIPTSAAPATTPASGSKTFWHKGAFWGDQDIRFKLPALKSNENLTLILGNVARGTDKNATPLTLVLKTEGANLTAALSRGADLKLKDGARKIDGAIEGQAVEISRRGTFVIVRVGGEDAQNTLLAAKISG